MSATNLLGIPRSILLGGAIAMLVAAIALMLKITQPNVTLQRVTLPRAAVAASVQPVDPAMLHLQLQRSRDEMALP
jgi:hypothetical protein